MEGEGNLERTAKRVLGEIAHYSEVCSCHRAESWVKDVRDAAREELQGLRAAASNFVAVHRNASGGPCMCLFCQRFRAALEGSPVRT